MEQFEVWKSIDGYEGLYEISNLGRVKRLHSVVTRKDGRLCTFPEVILRPHSNKGYHSVGLSKNGVPDQFLVHRLVAIAFIPNPLNKPCINHINGIKTDLRIENLEWCTRGENNTHAFATGLNKNVNPYGMKGKFGKFHHNSRPVLQISLAGKIVNRWDSSAEAARAIGAKEPNISKCIHGKALTTAGFKWRLES